MRLFKFPVLRRKDLIAFGIQKENGRPEVFSARQPEKRLDQLMKTKLESSQPDLLSRRVKNRQPAGDDRMAGGVRVRRTPRHLPLFFLPLLPKPGALEFLRRGNRLIHAGEAQNRTVVEHVGNSPKQTAALPESPQALLRRRRSGIIVLNMVEDQGESLPAGGAELPDQRLQRRTRHGGRLEVGGVFQTDLLIVERRAEQSRRAFRRIRCKFR